MEARARQMLHGAGRWWQAVPGRQRAWLAAAGVFVAALAAGMIWYAQRPEMRTLFAGMDARDVEQTAAQLAAGGIDFEMTPDGGGVRVPASEMDKARLLVAQKGMPQSGRMGFELFDKPNWVGSEFDEKVNYQRALEGELEHTIGTLGAVRSARVHLVMAEESAFASEAKPAKATVVLKLRNAALAGEQADSIRNLVAGAVEGLSPELVTLVDADGRVNLSPQRAAAGTREAESALETALEAKLVSVLEPLAGAGNVRATVSVTTDDSTVVHDDEVYDPEKVATTSVQRTEQDSGGQAAKAAGVPGTVSNTPAAAAPGSAQAAASGAAPPLFPQGNTSGQTMREESSNYAVSKHVVHSEDGPGRVARVSAAVVVNDRAGVEGSGSKQKTVWKPRSAEEMQRLTMLAQAAVGFTPTRGDTVTVENVGWAANTAEAGPGLMERAEDTLRGQGSLLRMLGVVACAALLFMLVLKPVASQMAESLKAASEFEPLADTSLMRAQRALAAPMEEEWADERAAQWEMQAGPEGLTAGARRQALSAQVAPQYDGENGDGFEYATQAPEGAMRGAGMRQQRAMQQAPRLEGVWEQVSSHARQEPLQASRLIEAWMAPEDGEGTT
jgi:flagellar M-ring protein FliF